MPMYGDEEIPQSPGSTTPPRLCMTRDLETEPDHMVDRYGHMLPEETVDEMNWPEIAERLPHTMKDIVYNASAWSCYPGASGTADYPLFIAGKPVVVLPPTWQPEWNEPRFIAAPQDPHPECINPTIPLTTAALRLATETFQEAIAFLKFFDGTFLVVYLADTDCAAVSTYVPKTFGGMLVQIDSSHFAVPCAAYTGPSAGIDPGNADLALMAPACKFTMEIDLQPNGRRRRFRAASGSNQLLFNTLMAPNPPVQPEAAGSQGRALPRVFGASIGEALIKANLAFLGSELECKKLKKEAEKQNNEAALVTQFSRAILWRTAGMMANMQGRSGSSLEVVETGEVCGFLNFQWRKNMIPPKWDRGLGPLLVDDDAAVEKEAVHVEYPVYGSYMLPIEVEEMEIVARN